jgi:hypothetical protein
MSGEQLTHVALIAHHVYGSTDLAYHCLRQLARRGAVEVAAADRYLAAAY